jgi:hypothetical protein
MQKGVDPIGIGVIALGVVMLIVLVVISNNQMPNPLPAPQMPDLNGLARKIEDPLSAAVGSRRDGRRADDGRTDRRLWGCAATAHCADGRTRRARRRRHGRTTRRNARRLLKTLGTQAEMRRP